MCMLEINKELTCKFLHDFIKSKYENNSGVLFTNTDSLIYESKTEDVYEDFSKDK